MRPPAPAYLLFALCLVGVSSWTEPVASSPRAFAPAGASGASGSRPSPETGRFDPGVVRATEGSPLAEVLTARREWRWVRARSVAEKALPTASPEDAARLRWMAAISARNVQDDPAAIKLLTPVAEGEGALARHARLKLADWLSKSDPAQALELLDRVLAELDGAPRRWPFTGRTQALRASALARAERTDEAIDALRSLASAGGRVSIRRQLADLLAQQDAVESQLEALQIYRQLAHHHPTSKHGRHGDKKAEELLAGLPASVRKEVGAPTLELRLARAEALLSAFRFIDARDAFQALLPEVQADEPMRCQVRYGHAKALVKAKRRKVGAPLMAAVGDDCDGDSDRRAWARYYAARAFSALGENAKAIEQYDALQRDTPAHSLADDALWRSARVARDMKDEERARAMLASLPDRYPAGDMKGRARFGMAWQARAEGRFSDAVAHFDLLLAEESAENTEDVHGRGAYWRARCLADLGRGRQAVAGYAALVRHWPLTYYGQQARARLLDLDPAQANALTARLKAKPAAELTFPRRALMDEGGFARALDLLRVGETSTAKAELAALGLIGDSANDESLWLVATLFDRAGAYADAVALVRKPLGESLLSKTPTGLEGAHWRVAYPQAYKPLIEDTARRFKVPPAFVRAVAREESGFNPAAVSPAKAYGLIQLILPTAEAVAKGLGMHVDPQSLRRPEVNLPVGTRFISGLSHRYHGQFALVPAAYNAGPAATARWLKERGDQDLDEWIENIPYDETRHYSRRVLQSYGIYTWLSQGELPRWPLNLPVL